jgi:hypothetical protein
VKTRPIVVVAVLLVAHQLAPARASSHREAPLISQDPYADNTDTIAFVSPKDPEKVTLIASDIPSNRRTAARIPSSSTLLGATVAPI